MHALVASPYKSAYNAAKHGVAGFTKTLALEVGSDPAQQAALNAFCWLAWSRCPWHPSPCQAALRGQTDCQTKKQRACLHHIIRGSSRPAARAPHWLLHKAALRLSPMLLPLTPNVSSRCQAASQGVTCNRTSPPEPCAAPLAPQCVAPCRQAATRPGCDLQLLGPSRAQSMLLPSPPAMSPPRRQVATQGVTCNCVCPGYVMTELIEKQLENQAKTRGISKARARIFSAHSQYTVFAAYCLSCG